jgi:hypothetical protein
MTVEKVKFVSVTRVIDDRKGIHYLDAIDARWVSLVC